MTFSTDLIFDVLMRYQSDHMLIEAAWADAQARLSDVGRLGALIERAGPSMVHMALAQISPLAVPVLMLIGRENVTSAATEDALIDEMGGAAGGERGWNDALIAAAMG